MLVNNVFAYHLRVQEAVTANAAMPLVARKDVRTPLGAFWMVFGIGHFNRDPVRCRSCTACAHGCQRVRASPTLKVRRRQFITLLGVASVRGNEELAAAWFHCSPSIISCRGSAFTPQSRLVLTPDALKKSSAGRKPFDAILMFRMLVLQAAQQSVGRAGGISGARRTRSTPTPWHAYTFGTPIHLTVGKTKLGDATLT